MRPLILSGEWGLLPGPQAGSEETVLKVLYVTSITGRASFIGVFLYLEAAAKASS